MRRELAGLALALLILTVTVASAASLEVSGGTIQGFVYDASLPHSTPTATPAPGAIVADIDIKPESLQKKSQGSTILAFIELPPDYLARDILIDSIRLCLDSEGCADCLPVAGPASAGDADQDGARDLKVTFDRASVIALLEPIPAPTTVVFAVHGMVGETRFSGSDTVKIVDPEAGDQPAPTATAPAEATSTPDPPTTSTATPVEPPTVTPTPPAEMATPTSGPATVTATPEATAVPTAIPTEAPGEPAPEPSLTAPPPTAPAEPTAPPPTPTREPDSA